MRHCYQYVLSVLDTIHNLYYRYTFRPFNSSESSNGIYRVARTTKRSRRWKSEVIKQLKIFMSFHGNVQTKIYKIRHMTIVSLWICHTHTRQHKVCEHSFVRSSIHTKWSTNERASVHAWACSLLIPGNSLHMIWRCLVFKTFLPKILQSLFILFRCFESIKLQANTFKGQITHK